MGTSLYSSALASKNISETELLTVNEIQVSNLDSKDLENMATDIQKTFTIPEKNEYEAVITQNKSSELTIEEREGLLYMLEEEKLARDVYLALYDLWGAPVFQNIAGSEQAHMDSILMLLDQ